MSITEKVMSDKRIEEIVDKMLKGSANSGFIPDIVEKSIYVNVLKLVVQAVDEIVESTSIQILGHEIKLDMKPLETS